MSLSNLICISFNIVSVVVANCIFDFAAFIGIMKGWSRDLEEEDDDDDDDKVEENFDFDVSPTLFRKLSKLIKDKIVINFCDNE